MAKYSYPDIPLNLISDPPREDLKISICIPCYYEFDIASTIQSLMECESIDGPVEIIVLINESDDDKEEVSKQNLRSYKKCIKLTALSVEKGLRLYPVYVDQITSKTAGVGYARRLAMDEANRRFRVITKERGIIACLDADTTVSKNYLIELIKFFEYNLNISGCSIAFEHDLNILDHEIKSAICDYELHLRYFINMQRLIGLPFAFQTVGSAMAVTSISYQKLGGMNTREAGEDFYFLHKYIKNGLVKELNSACVYPSARISDRVPFGTGKAVGDIISSGSTYQTYSSESFADIEGLVASIPGIYQINKVDYNQLSISQPLKAYLVKENFIKKIEEIGTNTKNYEAFAKRFFQWFDAFRLMKCLHYLRDETYDNINMSAATMVLFKKLDLNMSDDKYENLIILRRYDRSLKINDKLS